MKKLFSLLLVVLFMGVMVFGLVGCGTEETVETPEEEVVDEEPTGEEAVEEPEEETDEPDEPEEALDAGAVLLDAAKDYFAKTATDINIIPPADVKEMLDSNPNSIFILDIRSAEDFEAGHIPGAVHSAWAEVGNIMDRIPQNKPVVVACYSGQTAGQTVGVLRMAGFDNVKSLQSGINLGWVEAAGLPLDETGMNAAADLDSVSSPADEKEEIIWEAAKEFFAAVASGTNIIPGPELNEALEANPNSFYVLDIRSADDYAAGHIVGSVHSPWSEVGNLLEDLPSTRPIAVGCYSGQTAGQTVGVLRLLGFDAYSVQSGIRDGWVEKEGLPLVTE
ncbi:MAG: rhodanese-like domain-containing protein [Bacillota bacterium]|nr:rhodanese-like domain-containing protein [Bacillota bacterium]